MRTYSVPLAWSAPAGAGYVLIFTAPAIDTYIIRDVTLFNGSVGAAVGALLLTHGGVNYLIYSNPAIPANSSVHLELRQVLMPGDKVTFNAGQAGMTALMSGYHLSST